MRIARQPSPMQIMTDQKQEENVAYFTYFGSIITNCARCTREIKSKTSMAKAAFIKKTFSPTNWTWN
jgi:biotin synthase-related radical SAM superfamily protein